MNRREMFDNFLMYITEKYSIKNAFLNCHHLLNTWQISCKFDLIYLMLYRFTKGFLKSLQVFESFVYIFPIISTAMIGLAFTFFPPLEMWKYKRKTIITSLPGVYAVHLRISGFHLDLNKKSMFVHLNYSPMLLSCLTIKMHIEFYSHNREG